MTEAEAESFSKRINRLALITPMTEQTHFKHLNENQTYLTPEDWPKVDALLEDAIARRACSTTSSGVIILSALRQPS